MKERNIQPPIFEDLFDLKEIQAIQDSFAKTTGVASIITSVDGEPITEPSNFCRLCKDIIRKTKKGLANCKCSDAAIGVYNPDGPIVQPCLSGGLWDAGASISVGGYHIANWLIGQVSNEKTDINHVLGYAKEINADQKEFEKAYREVTVMSQEQFQSTSHSLFLIANQLSKQAYQKVKQTTLAREKEIAKRKLATKNVELQNAIDQLMAQMEKRKQVEADLKKKNEYMASLHETSLGMFSRLELSRVLETIINRASNLTKISDGFIFIYDRAEDALEIKAACGKYLALKGVKLKPGEGISGKVWETGESICINDYQSWLGKSNKTQFEFVTAAVGVPLTSGSKIEGAIGLSHHETGKRIQPDTLQILEQFAELATIAIDNAKLFEGLDDELNKRILLENERKDMESRLRQSQKMEAIGTLAGGIAHDFNNILFPVIGFSEMIMHDLPENSPIKTQLQPVLDGAERAKNLVQQILTFSRETEQDVRPLKIQLIIKEVLKLARASLPATIKITKVIPRDIGMVMADPTQIHQIVMNLITNASHAMEETGGKLSVELKKIELTNANLPKIEMIPGKFICLEISDTGCGMDQNTRKRIFEPYFTTKDSGKGTGLGLAVVHGIVKNLHGEVVVKSIKNRGTSFSVYLPRFIKKNGDTNMETISIAQLNGDERILLVDDEKPVLDIVAQVLNRFGYSTTTFNASTEALNCFKKSPDAFDLVITDMTMPELTGDKLIEDIKKIRPDIPVILCTGFSEKIVQGRTNANKPDKILMKPTGKDELLRAIRLLVDN